MANSFTQKLLRAQFTLGTVTNPQTGEVSQPTFEGTSNANQVKLDGYRMVAIVDKAGMPAMCALELRIYGLNLSVMNQLSTLGRPTVVVTNNSVSLSADSGNGFSQIFVGAIKRARIVLSSAPESYLAVTALSGGDAALQVLPPSSFPGAVDAADVLAGMAKQEGLNFEPNGVSVQLSSPYFPGSTLDQIYSCVRAAGVNMIIDNGTLAIWPRNGARGANVPTISRETGLIDYPSTSGQDLLSLRTLFNPLIIPGGKITVADDFISGANGTWTVLRLTHYVSSLMPDGDWMTTLEAAPQNYFTGGTPGTGQLFGAANVAAS